MLLNLAFVRLLTNEACCGLLLNMKLVKLFVTETGVELFGEFAVVGELVDEATQQLNGTLLLLLV